MIAKLWKVGLLAPACLFAAEGCCFLAHDPLSPPHVRYTACATGHVCTALEEKMSPDYQLWMQDVKHFWSDTCSEFSDEYHRNNDWPRPYTTLAEHSVRDPLETQAENARQQLATLWDYHFDSGTAQLNSMGYKRLQNIVSQSGALGQVVYVQRSSSSTETDLRIENVRKEMAQLDLAGVSFDVAQARTSPTEMSGQEAAQAMKRLTTPPKEKNSSYSTGGEFNNSGGSSSSKQ